MCLFCFADPNTPIEVGSLPEPDMYHHIVEDFLTDWYSSVYVWFAQWFRHTWLDMYVALAMNDYYCVCLFVTYLRRTVKQLVQCHVACIYHSNV